MDCPNTLTMSRIWQTILGAMLMINLQIIESKLVHNNISLVDVNNKSESKAKLIQIILLKVYSSKQVFFYHGEEIDW